MKKSLLLALIVLCSASLVHAQLAGSVGVFADAAGLSCEFVDVGGTAFIYVIHQWTDGATASEFKIDVPGCMIHLADSSPFGLKNGDFDNGTSISYQECLSHPIYLGYMIFTTTGTCPPCTYMSVVENPISVPAPSPGEVYVADCTPGDPQLLIGTGGELVINPTANCECDVPTEDTTWGQVKALFE